MMHQNDDVAVLTALRKRDGYTTPDALAEDPALHAMSRTRIVRALQRLSLKRKAICHMEAWRART